MTRHNTQSFLVRIWIEPREIEGEPLVWRGSVQQVSSGEQVYFKSFVELNTFIAFKSYIPYTPGTSTDAEIKEP